MASTSLLMGLFGCCAPRQTKGRGPASEGGALKAGGKATEAPPITPAMAITDPARACGDLTQAPRTLLEASARRVLTHKSSTGSSSGSSGPELFDASGAPTAPRLFVDAYMHALETKNASFADDPRVEGLLDEAVQLTVHQDKRTYHGKASVCQRLNRGVQRIVDMAAKMQSSSQPDVTVDGPTYSDGTWTISYKVQIGSFKLKLADEFQIAEGRITHLNRLRK